MVESLLSSKEGVSLSRLSLSLEAVYVCREQARVIPIAHPGASFNFVELYTKYGPIARQYVEILGGTVDSAAEDIVQDIFLKLWQKRDTLGEIHSMENYLFFMVKNRLNTERLHNKIKQKAIRTLGSPSISAAYTTDDDLQCRAIIRVWKEAVRSLPPRMRRVYELKEIDGLKNQAIADHIGISVSVAKQHVHSASKRLKAYMDARGLL